MGEQTNLPTKQKIKTALAEYFREKAEFRKRKAQQYPHDTRNTVAADSLNAVADYCMSIADDDLLLARLCVLRHCFTDEGDVFMEPRYLDEASQSGGFAVSCGFHGAVKPSDFLNEWVDCLEQEYPGYLKALGESGDYELEDDTKV